MGCNRSEFRGHGVRTIGGFTVIEALVVVFMMFAIFAMLLPTLGPMRRRSRLATGSSRVAGTLRLARNLAITNQAIYNVRVMNLAVDKLRDEYPSMAVYYVTDQALVFAPPWADAELLVDNSAKRVFEVPGSRIRMDLPLRFCAHPTGDLVGHPASDVYNVADDSTWLPRFGMTAEPGVNWNPLGQGAIGELYFLPDGSASVDCVICIRDSSDNLAVVGVKALSGEITQKRVD